MSLYVCIYLFILFILFYLISLINLFIYYYGVRANVSGLLDSTCPMWFSPLKSSFINSFVHSRVAPTCTGITAAQDNNRRRAYETGRWLDVLWTHSPSQLAWSEERKERKGRVFI